jgi:hypothetical protein
MVYDFNELKVFVQRHLGIDPDRINSKFKPITEKLTKAQLDQSVEINLDGITFTDKKGNKHKGFLYIESGGGVVAESDFKKELAEIHLKRETIRKHYL